MIKTNKGVTLTEVLVSIVVLGIAFVTAISILSTTNKLTIANERKSNTFTEVESLLELFSSDPDNFEENFEAIYKITPESKEETQTTYIIYYSSAFIKKQEQTKSPYYFNINYSHSINDINISLTNYKIEIKIFHNDEEYNINDNSSISLEIVE